MKFFLLVVVIASVVFQESQELPQQKNDVRNLLILANSHAINYKYTLRNAWESFKDFISKLKGQLKTLSQTLKHKIQILTERFQKKMDIMRDEFQKIIKDALVIGEDIKECLQGDKGTIEGIIKDILNNVTTCLATPVNFINEVNDFHTVSDLNDKIFYDEIQTKVLTRLATCTKSQEDCLSDVKNDIIMELDDVKWNISQKAFVSRNNMDDVLESIVQCVTEGLLKASATIADETIKIIQCVKEHHGI